MDHSCQRRGHSKLSYNDLEEEFEYNIQRKETLKRDVKKLEDEKEDLRITNWNNAKYTLEIERDKKELKSRIEQLERENIELKTKGKADHAESEINELKATIESDKHEAEEIFNELREENQNLKVQITNLLKCDECGHVFVEKSNLKVHFLSKHSSSMFKCDICDEAFDIKGDLKEHVAEQHSKITQKQYLIEKPEELLFRLKK